MFIQALLYIFKLAFIERMVLFMSRDVSDELNLFSLELQQSLSPYVLKQLAKKVGFVQRSSKYQAKDLVALCVWLS